jgi:hypothetical protein
LSRRNEGSGSTDDAGVFAVAVGPCDIGGDASDGGACCNDVDAAVRDARDDSGDETVRGAGAGRGSAPGDIGCEKPRVASGSRTGSAGALVHTGGGEGEVFATDAVGAGCVVFVRRAEVGPLAGVAPASATGVVLARERRGAAVFARGAASAASSGDESLRGVAGARRRTGFAGVAAAASAGGSATGLRRRVGFGRSGSSMSRV